MGQTQLTPKAIRVDIHGEYDVYCGRPTRYGNPFISRDDSKEIRIQKFEQYFLEHEWLKLRAVHELAGKRLACYCPMNESCHVDVIVKYLNSIGV